MSLWEVLCQIINFAATVHYHYNIIMMCCPIVILNTRNLHYWKASMGVVKEMCVCVCVGGGGVSD